MGLFQLITIVIIILIIIWLLTPVVSHFTNYSDPSWNQAYYGTHVNSIPTQYDTNSNSAVECGKLIHDAAKKASDLDVVGWAWNSYRGGPGQCRAITLDNVEPCFTLRDQSYVSKTVYDNLSECKKVDK